MMKTAELRKYRKNAEALEAIDRLLSKRMVADNVQASRGAPDFSLTLRKIENYAQDKDTYALLQAQRELKREQAAISTFISGIKERRIYQALYAYCIDGELVDPSWDQVADKLGENSPEALRKAVDRHLEKYFKNVRLCP